MSHDAELDELRAGVSCAVLLERHPPPWQLDKGESTRRCLKYRRGEGEIILVTHEGRGWWDPGSTAKGDVFSLVQHLEPGLNLGQVRKVLRPLAGLSPSFPEHLRKTEREKPVVPFEVRWARRRAPTRGSPTWRYLTEQRHLPEPVVIAAVRAGVLREGPYASAWFAHTDHDGRLTGFEMRGPDYRGFSTGGDKTLFRLPGRVPTSSAPMSRLVVAEAPIDAMSVAAIERLRADTLYVAVTGGMGPETLKVPRPAAAGKCPPFGCGAGGGHGRRPRRRRLRRPAAGDGRGRRRAVRAPAAARGGRGLERPAPAGEGGMRPDRAWVRLQSGKRLDLLDPDMAAWEDRDLAIGLSRTYRWGGHSRWDLPLSVAQHSLLVLVLRQQMQPHAPLDRDDALRELLHDGHEGFLSFDPISPVKPHLGPEFEDVAGRLQAAIGCRYGLPGIGNLFSARPILGTRSGRHAGYAVSWTHVSCRQIRKALVRARRYCAAVIRCRRGRKWP